MTDLVILIWLLNANRILITDSTGFPFFAVEMNAHVRQYLFGGIFLAFGAYQFYLRDYLEFWLYTLAGIAFIANALTSEPVLEQFKKPLIIFTWTVILATVVLFFYLLRYKFL
jgi:hypothetical protein